MAMRRLHLFNEHAKKPQDKEVDNPSVPDFQKGDYRKPIKDGITEYEVIMDGYRYVLTLDGESELCELAFPARKVQFHLDDIYMECPDLPILHDGRLNQHLRNQIETQGLSLPKTPYFPGLRLIAK